MAGLLSYGDCEGKGGHSLHVRSGSADWELISSPPSSPLPQSRDDIFGLDEFDVPTFSLLGSVFESNRFLQDDYFASEADKADLVPIRMVRGGNIARNDKAGLPSECSDGTAESQQGSIPLTVLPDLGCIVPSVSLHEASKKDEAVARLAFEWRSTASNISIETGVPSTKKFSQGDSASELCSASESSTFCISPHFPSQIDAPWYDTQVNVRRIQHCYYDCGRFKCADERGQPVVALDAEGFGSILSQGNNIDAIELINSNKGGRGLVCDSWLGRQFSVWQAQLARTNSVWSLALAAAVMGLLIMGRGWQHLQAQNRRLQAQNRNFRLQLGAKDQKITQLMCQLIYMKDSVSKSRQIPVIRVKSTLQIPQDGQ